MNEIIIRLEDGNYLHLQFGSDEVWDENCDAYIDYTLFDSSKGNIDGGQMEYSTLEKDCNDITDAIRDTICFVYQNDIDAEHMSYELTDLELDNGFDY